MKRAFLILTILCVSFETAFGAVQWGAGNAPISGVMVANDVRIDGVAPLAFRVGNQKFYVTEATTKANILAYYMSGVPVIIGYNDDPAAMWDPGDGKAYRVVRVHTAGY